MSGESLELAFGSRLDRLEYDNLVSGSRQTRVP